MSAPRSGGIARSGAALAVEGTRRHRGGVLSSADADLLEQMARYRNRMVHFYHEVSAQELYELLTGRLGDVERLTTVLTRWVSAHPELIDRSL
jgi:hypothetical protein